MTKKISVFGGSSPKPGSPAYQEAYQLGSLLGSAGLTVLTGGYIGTMEATSRGASESGAHVIGVTSAEIEAWRPIGPNPWVDEEWRCETLRERLITLVEKCDAAIALPGGIGTLLEITLTWNQLVINALPAKPLILIGQGWKKTFETFFTELDGYTQPENKDTLTFATDPENAFSLLVRLMNLS